MQSLRSTALALAVCCAVASLASATVLRVPQDHARITDALNLTLFGDTVRVAAGTYSAAANGETFPLALTRAGVVLEGAGMGLSVLDAAQAASVVRCAAVNVRVSGFTITGGRDSLGAGVRVESGNAQVDHNLVIDNAAVLRGSGIYAAPGSTPWIHHDVVWRSTDALPASAGDPHGIQLTASNALVEFNTVGRGDSNGLIAEGGAEPVIRSNIFFENGSATLNRGRGICALGGPATVIRNNVFYGNHIAAILIISGSAMDLTAQQADAFSPSDGILENLDASPAFLDANAADVHLTPGSPAIDGGYAGSPLDPDGTRADAGAIYFDQAVTNAGGGPDDARGLRLSVAPNPFRGATQLAFTLARPGMVRLAVYGASGQRVRGLIEGEFAAGPHQVGFDGRDERGARLAGGVYFVRLEVEGGASVQKLLLVP
ncbi:MAG: right-handed parallel beta-helix repeat-containing protein [Candidatus Eisenbacteria bacterium]